MNDAPNPFAEQRIDIAADEEEQKRGRAGTAALLAYLPERKKSNLKSGRVFKYNNERETHQREGEGLEEGGWVRKVRPVRPSVGNQRTAVCH